MAFQKGHKPFVNWTGRKHTEESKRKMRRKHKPMPEEAKKKISETLKGRIPKFIPNNKGRKHTEEFKKNLSLKQKGILRPDLSGNRHWNWLGGKSFEPYTLDWTRSLRISIRERDKYTCKICGDKQCDRAFPVHHIDYNKKNCNPDNLITICTSCHIKTNYNRDYWLNYFKNI